MNPEEMIVTAAREMNAYRGVLVVLDLDATGAMGLLATLQLALRHPKNIGRTSDQVRRLATQIEAKLAELGPATKQLCAMGWDQSFDQ